MGHLETRLLPSDAPGHLPPLLPPSALPTLGSPSGSILSRSSTCPSPPPGAAAQPTSGERGVDSRRGAGATAAGTGAPLAIFFFFFFFF